MRKSKLCLLLIFFVLISSCLFEKKNDTVSPEIKKIPDAPKNIYFSAGDSKITISWDNVSNATSYNLYLRAEAGITKDNYNKKYEDVKTPFTATGLTNAKTYYFCVESVNDLGASGLSKEISCCPKLRDTPWLQVFPESAGIKKGATQQFEIMYVNEAGKIDTSVTTVWKSSDATIATINSAGLAEALNIGKTFISAAVKGEKSMVVLDVLPDIMGNAPNFTLPDINGKNVSLSDYAGKVIILDFWATWCPPCRVEIPHFVELYDAYKDKGLVIIGIDVDPSENAGVLKPFAADYGITYPLLLGTATVENLYGGIQRIPTTFIIDRNGNIIQKFIGSREKSVFEEEILKLL